MLSLLVNLSLLAFAGAFSPVLISISILLLSTGRPLGNTIAYVLGLIFSLIVVGGLALVLFNEPILLAGPRHGIGPGLSFALGGLCLVVALRSYLRVPDPDAPPPKWLASIETDNRRLPPAKRKPATSWRRGAEISLVDAGIIRGRPPLVGGGARQASRPGAACTLRPIRS